MNSVQLNFFIHPDDLEAIEMFLIEQHTMFMKQPTLDVADPYTISIKYPKAWPREFATVCLVDPRFVDSISFGYVERQGYHLVEEDRSCVMVLNRGGFSPDGEKLNRARLYFTKFFYNEGYVRVMKDEAFVAWATGIVKSIKKKFLQQVDDKKDFFVSPRVISWAEENQAEITPGLYLSKGKASRTK